MTYFVRACSTLYYLEYRHFKQTGAILTVLEPITRYILHLPSPSFRYDVQPNEISLQNMYKREEKLVNNYEHKILRIAVAEPRCWASTIFSALVFISSVRHDEHHCWKSMRGMFTRLSQISTYLTGTYFLVTLKHKCQKTFPSDSLRNHVKEWTQTYFCNISTFLRRPTQKD